MKTVSLRFSRRREHGRLLSSRYAKKNRGQALIGLLVVGLILIGLYMLFLGPRQGADGELRPSVAKQSIDRSKEVAVGGNNLQQIQYAITMYKEDNEGKPPASLDVLKNSVHGRQIPAEMWVDPVTGQPYSYDPATGTVGPPAAPGAAPPAQPAAPGQPAQPAPNNQLPGVRGPGNVRLPDMQPRMPSDAGEP